MAEDKALAKKTAEPSPVKSNKFKWEQGLFVEAMQKGWYNKAMSILETTVRTPEARMKWLQREDVKEYIYAYFEWLKDQRFKAGEKDWKMHQQVLDETRELLGIEREPQKVEVTIVPILGGLSKKSSNDGGE